MVHLSFSPTGPATFIVGGPPITTSAIGTPPGGTYTGGGFTDSGTSGIVSTVDLSDGSFTFGGASTGGEVSVPITYTSPSEQRLVELILSTLRV